MNWKRYIWLISLLLGIMPSLTAQYVNIVCVGDAGVVYKVAGNTGSSFVWEVAGGTIVQDYGDSIVVDWGDVAGEFDIRVQEFSNYGCPAVPKTGKVHVSSPDIDLGPDDEICQGEFIEFDLGGDNYSYLWHDNSTAASFVSEAEGKISVEVIDQYGCVQFDSMYLTVHPLPIVDLGPDTTLCGEDQLILDAGQDGVLFYWSTGDGSREITVYKGSQTIWVEAIDGNNCVSYDTIVISPCSVESRFKNMPTAFTPNGDGKNDVWGVPELESFPLVIVEIYDRWGKIVYRSEPGYSTPWDGISQDGRVMPMDSYYFVIDLADGISEPLVGTVTLIK